MVADHVDKIHTIVIGIMLLQLLLMFSWGLAITKIEKIHKKIDKYRADIIRVETEIRAIPLITTEKMMKEIDP